jgi:hypothetical protein
MKIKIKNNSKKKESLSEYIIPLPVVMYLNEMYDKDVSFEIIRYFLYYLKENNINYLSSYINDHNEIKITLNNLSNKNIEFNKKLNDLIVESFSTFLQEKDDNLFIFEEVFEDLSSLNKYNEYETLFENKRKEIEEENNVIEIDLIEEVIEPTKEVEQIDLNIISLEEDVKKIIEEVLLEKNIDKSIEHEWNQTSLRFKNKDGSWGKWVDLKGASGSSSGGHGGGGTSKRKIQWMIDKSIEEIVFPSGSSSKSFSFFS